MVADQGIAGLSAVHPDLPDAVMRSTGWQLVLRQGSATDAEKISALFGMTRRADVAQSSDGRITTRWRDEPRVKPHWLLVFAASAPPQCGAYILLAHDGRLLYVGSAFGQGGLRRRLGEHLAHVRACDYGDQWTIRTVWCKVVPTDDSDQAQVLELLTQRILRPAVFSTPRLRFVP